MMHPRRGTPTLLCAGVGQALRKATGCAGVRAHEYWRSDKRPRFRELHALKETVMRILPIVLAFAAIGASAQTIDSGQADQERRERNREEALASYRAGNTKSTSAKGRKETNQ